MASMRWTILIATILSVVSVPRYEEAHYRSLENGYTYSYILEKTADRFVPATSFIQCAAISLNNEILFFTYDKVVQLCKLHSSENIMTVTSGPVNDQMSFYRSSEWITAYTLTMGANSLIYNSFINKGSPLTWNVDSCLLLICPNFFRHPLLDIWEHLPIEEVKLVLYDNQIPVVTMVFNGRNTTLESWFSASNLKSSPWTNPAPDSFDYFSIIGDGISRRFYISNKYNLCLGDSGWMIINEELRLCPYDAYLFFPNIYFSRTSSSVTWGLGHRIADSIAVFIRLRPK